MLNVMRQNAGSWIIKILLGIIVVAFIFMGAGSFNARQASRVATVNGETISIGEYQQAYYNVLENLRAQFGNRLNDEMIKMFNVKQQALDGLIETALLRQVAEKNGLRVPDAELAQSIAHIPAFQKNGVFDKQRYKMLLSQNRLTPEAFEARQRESMLMSRLQTIITKTAKVSEDEIREWYNWENTSVNFAYAAFRLSSFTDVEVTDQMIEDYFAAHKEEYKTQPKRQARFVRFDPADYRETVDVTPEEIKQYYDNNPEEFQKPETVSARHILFKVPEGADDKTVEAIRAKALEVMEKAKAGEDFAELAKTYSEGPSKDKGGQLGEFERGKMVKPFSDAAFSMNAGDISEPVRTNFGWHIIKVEAHNPASTLPLDEATPQITEKIKDRKARNAAYDAAVALYDITFDGEEFENNAKDSGLELITTDFFTRQKGPENVGNPSAFAETAFKLPMGELSDITEIGDSYYVIQAFDKKPETIPDLADVKDKVAKAVKREQQKIAAKQAAEKFLKTVKTAGSLAAAISEDDSIQIKETGPVKRNASIPGIGKDNKLITAAFSLSENHKLPDEVIDGDTGLYVIELKEKILPDEQGLEKKKNKIHDRILAEKQGALFRSWVKSLRKNSEIKISKDFLDI